MVFLLQRYIFRELVKVFVLATVALTLIMSLGSILKPIQEYGVGPTQVLHLMGYFLPITLTFVLPMSALFAAALVYGRFASDNELDACRASGISLLTLVYPGLVLAIIVAIANLILNFHVVPAFVHRAEKALKADAKQILFRNIQRRGFYRIPGDDDYRIYADEANPNNDTLLGVIITKVKKGTIERIIDIKRARIIFNPHERFNEVRIAASDFYQIGSENEGWVYFERLPVMFEVPSLLGDDIKFKKIGQMKKIKANPILFYPVEKKARVTYAQYTAELLAQDISEKTAMDSNDFYELLGEPDSVKFIATNCSANNKQQVELTGEVTVLQFDLDMDMQHPVQTWRCTRALINIEGDELAPTLKMELYSPRWQKKDGSEGFAAGRKFIRGLVLPQPITDQFKTEDVLEAISPLSTSSVLGDKASKTLKSLQAALEYRIKKTIAEIRAEIHTRLVFGIGCVALIMIGTGLGIIFKGGHLLSAFGASSIPGGLLVIFMMTGNNIAKNLGSQIFSGIALMWSGVAVLVFLAFVIYRKLLKN